MYVRLVVNIIGTRFVVHYSIRHGHEGKVKVGTMYVSMQVQKFGRMLHDACCNLHVCIVYGMVWYCTLWTSQRKFSVGVDALLYAFSSLSPCPSDRKLPTDRMDEKRVL